MFLHVSVLDFINHCQLVALMNLTNVLSEKLCHNWFPNLNLWFDSSFLYKNFVNGRGKFILALESNKGSVLMPFLL